MDDIDATELLETYGPFMCIPRCYASSGVLISALWDLDFLMKFIIIGVFCAALALYVRTKVLTLLCRGGWHRQIVSPSSLYPQLLFVLLPRVRVERSSLTMRHDAAQSRTIPNIL